MTIVISSAASARRPADRQGEALDRALLERGGLERFALELGDRLDRVVDLAGKALILVHPPGFGGRRRLARRIERR
jgi:hypothetical protein